MSTAIKITLLTTRPWISIHSASIYHPYYVLGIVLGSGDRIVIKTDTDHALVKLTV